MLLPDRGEPDDGITPGLIGPVNPRLPSIRDGEPPMPARTQKHVPPAHADLPRYDPAVGWARAVLLGAALAVVLSIELPWWAFSLVLLAPCMITDKALQRLLPKRLRQQPRVVQTDSGDTWITHVPSIVAEDAHGIVRGPFRAMSALIALLFMWMAMVPAVDMSLSMRIMSFLGGVVFGAITLVPAGDVRRMLPRISTAPPLPAPGGDADAGQAVGEDFRTRGED